MADLTYSVDVNTTPALTALNSLQTKIKGLSTSFSGLQGALAGLFLGATISGAMKYADAISDISTATNIAIANVLGFSHAVEQNGGTAEGAQKALGKFGIAIGEAAGGSDKAQNAFNKVGVTLNDLRNLSEKDLLAKTIKGLAAITDASKRAAAQNDIFGKSMRGVDMAGVQGGYAQATAESLKYAAAVKTAGEVEDKLAAAFQKFQLALLVSMKPLADFVSELKPEQIEKFIDAVVKIGGAVGGIVIATKVVSGLTVGITTLTALAIAGATGIATGWAALGAAFTKVGVIIRAIGLTFSAVWDLIMAGVLGVGTAFARISSMLGLVRMLIGSLASLFVPISAAVGIFLLGLGKILLVVAAVSAALYTIASVVDYAFDTKIVDTFVEYAKKAWGVLKDISALVIKPKLEFEGIPNIPRGRPTNPDTVLQQQAVGQEIRDEIELEKRLKNEAAALREVKNALDAKILSIQQGSKAYAEQNYQTIMGIQFANTLIGKTEEESAVLRAQEAVFVNASNASKKLREEKAAMLAGLKEGETNLGYVYDEEIKKIVKLAQEDAARIGNAITNNQSLVAIEKYRLQNIQDTTKAIEDQISRQQTLGGLLQGANDKSVDVAFEASQQGKNPLQKQMAQIQEDARKAAMEAGRTFASGFEGMDLSTDQARELADGLDLIAQKYKKIADAQLENLAATRTSAAGQKDAIDSLVESFSPYNVAQMKTQAVWGDMSKAIDNFVDTGKFSFGDFAKSVIQDLIKIELKSMAMKIFQPMMSAGTSFLSSLFGFADGGQPPVGKASIVGERGPELFVPRSAGTIIPNNQLGGGGGSNQTVNNITNNNYTVNAVDAKSVAQLFAENRRTLLGTVRMAEKEQPFASR